MLKKTTKKRNPLSHTTVITDSSLLIDLSDAKKDIDLWGSGIS